MPNWVKNIVKFNKKGNENILNEFLTEYEEGEKAFDFDKIIPMPKDLNIQSSSYGEIGLMLLHSHSNLSMYNKEIINETLFNCQSKLNPKSPNTKI